MVKYSIAFWLKIQLSYYASGLFYTPELLNYLLGPATLRVHFIVISRFSKNIFQENNSRILITTAIFFL